MSQTRFGTISGTSDAGEPASVRTYSVQTQEGAYPAPSSEPPRRAHLPFFLAASNSPISFSDFLSRFSSFVAAISKPSRRRNPLEERGYFGLFKLCANVNTFTRDAVAAVPFSHPAEQDLTVSRLRLMEGKKLIKGIDSTFLTHHCATN